MGQLHVRRRADPRAGRHHLRHPALRWPRNGVDEPDGARRAHRWPRAARAVRDDRTARRRADVQPAAVQDPRVPRRQRRQLHDLDRARRPAVHAHHLAAGHLAPAARLQLRRHAVVGRHLHAPADPRLPRRRSGVGLPVRPLRRAPVRHHRHGRDRAQLRTAHAAARRLRVPGVRGAAAHERHRRRAVHRAQHHRDHEQRGAAPSAARRRACARRSRTARRCCRSGCSSR